MGVLRDIYDQFKGFLHHGPSMAPFHEAMVDMHEMHERLIEELQTANARLHAGLNKLELRVEAAFPQRSPAPPVYISPPTELNQDSSAKLPAALVQQAALFAVTKPVPDDPASLTTAETAQPSTDQPGATPEPNPAEPQKDEGPLLPEVPEAASAGSTEPAAPANQGE